MKASKEMLALSEIIDNACEQQDEEDVDLDFTFVKTLVDFISAAIAQREKSIRCARALDERTQYDDFSICVMQVQELCSNLRERTEVAALIEEALNEI